MGSHLCQKYQSLVTGVHYNRSKAIILVSRKRFKQENISVSESTFSKYIGGTENQAISTQRKYFILN